MSAGAQPAEWFARIPLWLRIAAPVIVVAVVAIIVAVAIAAPPTPATPDSACRTAATDRLESRGHTAVELADSLEVAEADGAQRVSGTVTFVDDSGATHHALVRCVVRTEGDAMRVTSVRFFD